MADVAIGTWRIEAVPGVVGTASRLDTLDWLVRTSEPGCDIVEVRLDQLLEEGSGWVRRCRELHGGGIPLILTLRHESERGQWSGSNGQRLDILRQARSWVGCVDVEIRQEAVARAVAALAGTTVIGSFHDFEATPPDDDLDALVRRGAADGAHIVKIASWVEDEATLLRLEALPGRHPDVHLALVGMGPLGPESRVRLPRKGSCLTYGYLDASVAPGQVSAAQLKQALGGGAATD